MRRKPLRRPGVALALRRRPRLHAVLVGLLAVGCGTAVAATVQEADDARRAWGEGTDVLVATVDIEAGDRLTPGNTRVVSHPSPLVPSGALSSVPAGARATSP